jgi:hypothetical protein
MSIKTDTRTRVEVVTTTKRTSTITLTGRMIAEMVMREHDIPLGSVDVQVTFDVPGGGDWSNETINVSTDHPITVTWTQTQETRG